MLAVALAAAPGAALPEKAQLPWEAYPAATSAERARGTVASISYSFDVEANGLPQRTYIPPPSGIDVTYRDLDTGRMVTVRGVDAEWVVRFSNPRFSPAQMDAVAHGGGHMWCALEASDAKGSGWAMSDHGRHRCSLTRPL